MPNPPAKLLPLDSGFIDLPGRLIEKYRSKGEASELGRILASAKRLQEEVDRVVVLGIGGSQGLRSVSGAGDVIAVAPQTASTSGAAGAPEKETAVASERPRIAAVFGLSTQVMAQSMVLVSIGRR